MSAKNNGRPKDVQINKSFFPFSVCSDTLVFSYSTIYAGLPNLFGY